MEDNKLRYNAPFIFGQHRSKAMFEVVRDYHISNPHKEDEGAERLVKCWNEYDTLVKERELLIEALSNMVNSYEKSRGLLMITYLHPEYSKAKELLNNLQK